MSTAQETERTVLRPMRWWDVAAVLPLEAALFGADGWSVGLFWSELGEAALAGTRRYLVAESDGRVVGYAGLYAAAGEGYVQTLGVAPDRRRRGVGAMLLTELLAEAGRRGLARVALEVRADAAAAQALYLRHGFRPVGRRARYYQPSGVDAVVMVRGGAS